MKLSVQLLSIITVAIFAVATLYSFFGSDIFPPDFDFVYVSLYHIVWGLFMLFEALVFGAILLHEYHNSLKFQVPTIALMLTIVVNTILTLTNGLLLLGAHYFDSPLCFEMLNVLHAFLDPVSVGVALEITSALALLGLGYAMSSRGMVWFLPAFLAFAQVACQLAIHFKLFTLPQEFILIQYYATWPIFYLLVAWYYEKVVPKSDTSPA